VKIGMLEAGVEFIGVVVDDMTIEKNILEKFLTRYRCIEKGVGQGTTTTIPYHLITWYGTYK
jgi:hypothetical protein